MKSEENKKFKVNKKSSFSDDNFLAQQDKFEELQAEEEKKNIEKSIKVGNLFEKNEEKMDQKEKKIGSKITRPSVKTYRDFAIKALKDKPTSLAKMIIKEKKKQEIDYKYSVKNKKNIFKIVLSIFLIILGILAVASVLIFSINKKNEIKEKEKTISPKSIIYFDYKSEEKFDDIKRRELINLMNKVINHTNIPIRSIKIFYFVKKNINGYKELVSASDFLKVIDTKAPIQLVRNLENEFSLGIVSLSESISPFLIFKISDFDTVYSGMLSWESTILPDLGDFFLVNRKYYAQSFSDITIYNKDVRAIFDEEGKIVFAYSFLDLDTLVFFKDSSSFRIIVSTLQNKKERF